MKVLFIAVCVFAWSFVLADAVEYTKTYNRTAGQYMMLFESTLEPLTLETYLNECANTLKKAAEFGEPDPGIVMRLKKYERFVGTLPTVPRNKEKFKQYRDETREILEGLGG